MFASGFNESATQATSTSSSSSARNSPRARFAELDGDDDVSYDEDDWDEDDNSDVEEEDFYDDEPISEAATSDRAHLPSTAVTAKIDVPEQSGEGQVSHGTGSGASSAAVSDEDETDGEDLPAADGSTAPEGGRTAPNASPFVDAPIAPESPTKAVTFKERSSGRPTSQDEDSLVTAPKTAPDFAPIPAPAASPAPAPKQRKPKDTRPRFEVVVTDAA